MSAQPVGYAEVVEGIRAAITAYCHALDDGRTDDIVAQFTTDGSIELPGFGITQGHEALRALYSGLVPKAPQLHVVVNTLVSQWNGDQATVRSDLVLASGTESGWAVGLVGRYDDVVRHEDGRWRFVSRAMTIKGS